MDGHFTSSHWNWQKDFQAPRAIIVSYILSYTHYKSQTLSNKPWSHFYSRFNHSKTTFLKMNSDGSLNERVLGTQEPHQPQPPTDEQLLLQLEEQVRTWTDLMRARVRTQMSLDPQTRSQRADYDSLEREIRELEGWIDSNRAKIKFLQPPAQRSSSQGPLNQCSQSVMN